MQSDESLSSHHKKCRDSDGLSLLSLTGESAADDLTTEEFAVPAEKTLHSVDINPFVGRHEYCNEIVSAEELAEDIGYEGLIPVVAETVFVSGSRKPNNYIPIVLTSCGVLIAAAIMFYIVQYLLLAESVIRSPLAIDKTAMDKMTGVAESMRTVEQANQYLTDIESVNDGSDDSLLLDGEATSVAMSAAKNVVEDTLGSAADNTFAASAATLSADASSPAVVATQRLIKLSRRQSDNGLNGLLSTAYEQYLAGDYARAEKTYREVLAVVPQNYDALLGMAAIAERNGALDDAYQRYLKVLTYYPDNNTALAALINLQAKGDLARNISMLKRLLQDQPNNAFLYHSLGHIYAAQRRWSEAEKAFFHAYVNDDVNADYAYSLAVSLEHIGQPQSAVEYYAIALDRGHLSAVNFDTAVVLSRIAALSVVDSDR